VLVIEFTTLRVRQLISLPVDRLIIRTAVVVPLPRRLIEVLGRLARLLASAQRVRIVLLEMTTGISRFIEDIVRPEVLNGLRLLLALRNLIDGGLTVRIRPTVLPTVIINILVVIVIGWFILRAMEFGFHLPRVRPLLLLLGQLLGALLIQLRGLAAIHFEPPVAYKLRLLKYSAVGA